MLYKYINLLNTSTEMNQFYLVTWREHIDTTMDSSISDWSEIIKTRKPVRIFSDKIVCGNVIAEYKDNIIIMHGEFVSHQHMIPKSKVDSCDGNELHLNIPYSMLSRFDF